MQESSWKTWIEGLRHVPGAARPVVALSLVVCAVAIGSGGTEAARPAPPAADDPSADEEEREFRRANARALVRDNCLICHSEELLTGQKLTPAQWKTEVEKMVGWGSPLPPDQVAPLVEFLAESYSESTPSRPPARISPDRVHAQYGPEALADGSTSGDAGRGGSLYRANCATCHGEAAQGGDLGPNLVEAAVLLRPRDYAAVVRDGRHRMPGFKLVLQPAQENDVLAWLGQRRYELPMPK